jgi:ferric-dicitrate binding protein FerR (iron transport regulator)
VSTRRRASTSRASERRKAAKAPPRATAGRRRARRRPRRRRQRTLILFGIALAGAAALLWGVVRIGTPQAKQFRLAPPTDAGARGPIEIEEGEREELRSLIDELGRDAAQ